MAINSQKQEKSKILERLDPQTRGIALKPLMGLFDPLCLLLAPAYMNEYCTQQIGFESLIPTTRKPLFVLILISLSITFCMYN